MQRLQGLAGIVLILGVAYLVSNNKKRINYRLVLSGIILQVIIAVLVLKISFIGNFFQWLGRGMERIEMFARQGASFVYAGVNVTQPDGSSADYVKGGFVFAFNVTATIILVCAVVAVLYHYNIMQRVVSIIARAMNYIMRV